MRYPPAALALETLSRLSDEEMQDPFVLLLSRLTALVKESHSAASSL